MVVGLCGNILSIVVLSRKRMRITTTSVYLRFLAVSDSLVLLIGTLRQLIYFYSDIDIRELTDLACKVHLWLAYNVIGLSCWLLCVISTDRLLAIKFPLWAKSHCTKRIALVIVIVLSVAVSLIDSHLLMFMYRDEVYSSSNKTNTSVLLDVACNPNPTNIQYVKFKNKVWPFLTFFLYSFSPIVWLVTCNIFLFKQLSLRHVKKQKSRQVDTEGRRERKDLKSLTKMLIVLCVFFIVVTVPTCVYMIVTPYVFARTSAHDTAKKLLFSSIASVFLYSNNTFNFIIYCVSGSLFRKELRHLFKEVKVYFLKRLNIRIDPHQTLNESTLETKAGPSIIETTCTNANDNTAASNGLYD